MVETNAIVAAERAGVEHIVKVSNLPGRGPRLRVCTATTAPSNAGSRESPWRPRCCSRRSSRRCCCRQLALLRRGRLVLPTGAGRIAWIDPRDIAAVAATVLVDPDPPRGPAAAHRPGGADRRRARAANRLRRRAAEIALVQPDAREVERRSGGRRHGSVARRVDRAPVRSRGTGALAGVSPDVERVLGRPPRPIDEWLRDELVPRLRRRE